MSIALKASMALPTCGGVVCHRTHLASMGFRNAFMGLLSCGACVCRRHTGRAWTMSIALETSRVLPACSAL